jgi:membrane protease YdiL (CAAX protease family)
MDLGGRRNGQQYSRASLIVALYSALAGAGIAIGYLRGHPNVYLAGAPGPWWRLALSPAIGVAVGLAIVFVSRLAVHQFDWARSLHRSFRGLLGTLHPRDILILAAASSIGEEILFRGALLPWIGVIGSAVIFALLHIGPGVRYLPWTVSAFLVGCLFGGMYLVMGDLGGPIAAHFTINYLNLGYIVRVELPET